MQERMQKRVRVLSGDYPLQEIPSTTSRRKEKNKHWEFCWMMLVMRILLCLFFSPWFFAGSADAAG